MIHSVACKTTEAPVRTGFLEAQSWEARLGTLPELVRLPAYELWRSSLGRQSHTADFLKLLDELAQMQLEKKTTESGNSHQG